MSKLPPALKKLALPVIGSPLFIISNPKLVIEQCKACLLYTSPSPRDKRQSRMPSSA